MINWAGTLTYSATAVERPASLDELRTLLAAAEQIRVVGSTHSFSDIGDAARLVALDALPADVELDGDTVSLNPALTYAQVAHLIPGHALHNLASLPHITVGGAIATATHGSGARNGNLATAVCALQLVTSTGDVIEARRGDPEFAGMVVGLGALGAVTRVTLDLVPDFSLRQDVFEGLSWTALLEHLDAIMESAYSVSAFSRFGDAVEQVWIKGGEPVEELYDATKATVERHPILGLDPDATTRQRGLPGPWYDRLPHFRIEATPSAGEEIQSEFFVAREHGAAAIEAVLAIGDDIRDVLLVSELRTVAADELWMSPQYRRASLGLHFTWRREPEAVSRSVEAVEHALAPFDPRPHWGKVFRTPASYERGPDFAALTAKLDPRGAFANAWLSRVASGPRS
jgi:xylitol oxidase